LRATFDSVDQGAKTPVEWITFEERTLRFAIPAIGGTYEGRMTAGGDRIEGTWSQRGRQFPLTLERLTQPFALERPQTPEPPFPYQSVKVDVRNIGDEVTLGCTLLVPHGRMRSPAVLFLSGSGAQDRNETLLGHEPFLTLRAREEALHGQLTPRELEQLQITPATTQAAIQRVATPWFRSLIRQNPADYLSRLEVPVLALFGAKDVQVSPEQNAAAVERALERAPTKKYVVRVLPGLNHLFQHATTGALSEYATIEETIAPQVLTLVADWIDAHISLHLHRATNEGEGRGERQARTRDETRYEATES
jgi:hypothetical protein